MVIPQIFQWLQERQLQRLNKKNLQTRHRSLLDASIPPQVAEAYKSVRLNLTFILAPIKRCKCLLITSANPGEGKTTSSVNLAISFAATDAKVLLIDADMRKPRIHRIFKENRHNGLSDLLNGLISPEDAIRHTEKSLDFIPAGQIPPDPAALASEKAFRALLSSLTPYYDYIFVDSPPVTLVPETVNIAKVVDGVVLVVRQDYTIIEGIRQALADLSLIDIRILGVVLNDVHTLRDNRYGWRKYAALYRKSAKPVPKKHNKRKTKEI